MRHIERLKQALALIMLTTAFWQESGRKKQWLRWPHIHIKKPFDMENLTSHIRPMSGKVKH